MEPTQDIRLKLYQRKKAREEASSSSSSSDKENHTPAGVQMNPPKRFGRGRGSIMRQRQNVTDNNYNGLSPKLEISRRYFCFNQDILVGIRLQNAATTLAKDQKNQVTPLFRRMAPRFPSQSEPKGNYFNRTAFNYRFHQ